MKSKYFLIVAGLMLVLFSYSSAQVPQMINYQGKLTKSTGAPLDTTIQMVFSIYADPITQTPLWTETQIAVSVEKGIFNVLLGSVTPIPYSTFDGSVRYLGVRVGGDPEIAPRKPIVSVAYAFKSVEADTAGYAKAAASTPRGIIAMWSGTLASIPGGWALCDGGTYTAPNGEQVTTPDLRDRFILGASAGENPGATGGTNSYSLSVAQLPSHSHSLTIDAVGPHFHGITITGLGGGGIANTVNYVDSGPIQKYTTTDGAHAHTGTVGSTGSGAAIDNRPAYYKLAFIMKL
jgi:microcystin-dependent protein